MRNFIDTIALFVIRVLVGALRVLPYPFSFLFAFAVVSIARLLLPRAKKVALRNLELVFPEKPLGERKQIYRRFWRVLARNLESFAKVCDLTPERALASTDIDELQRAVTKLRPTSANGGLIVATAHIGSFERGAQVYGVLFRPAHFLARDFNLPKLDRWWKSRRESLGSTVYSRKGGYKATLERLRQGHDVGILIDQNVKKNYASFVDFFGISAATTKTLGHAAVKTRSPVIFAAQVELARGRYKIYAREIYNPQEPISDDLEVSTCVIIERVHRVLEEIIRKHPEQWFWIHRRFKTRPEGQPEELYEGI